MHDTISQLARTLTQANRFLAAQLEHHGLGGIAPSHGDVFVQLFAHDQLPMSELAQRIGRDPSTVTALVKKLAANGYVTTTKQHEDKRVVLVSLTEKGRALQGVFEEISSALVDTQCHALTNSDLDTLDHTLHTMQQNFKTALEGDPS